MWHNSSTDEWDLPSSSVYVMPGSVISTCGVHVKQEVDEVEIFGEPIFHTKPAWTMDKIEDPTWLMLRREQQNKRVMKRQASVMTSKEKQDSRERACEPWQSFRENDEDGYAIDPFFYPVTTSDPQFAIAVETGDAIIDNEEALLAWETAQVKEHFFSKTQEQLTELVEKDPTLYAKYLEKVREQRKKVVSEKIEAEAKLLIDEMDNSAQEEQMDISQPTVPADSVDMD